MTDYHKYINSLRKSAKEHDNDRTSMGHIIVSDLCRDTADLLEEVEQQPCEDCKVKKDAYIQGYDYGVKDWFSNAKDKINAKEWLSSFNTDSATDCFTAVQKLKEAVYENKIT